MTVPSGNWGVSGRRGRDAEGEGRSVCNWEGDGVREVSVRRRWRGLPSPSSGDQRRSVLGWSGSGVETGGRT